MSKIGKLHYLTSEEERAIKDSIPWAEIDSKIREIVRLANDVSGIATVQSCEGHVEPRDDHFVMDSALVAFKATKERLLEFLLKIIPNWRKGCIEVGIRYFGDGSFWISIGVDPSRRRQLYDLFKRFQE